MASLVPEAPIPIALEVQAMSLSTSELEVMQWLESIGFERYQPNFVANDVFSFAVVREIDSVTDLVDLGIPKLSAKALMRHVEELKANGFTAPPKGSTGAGEEDDDALKKEKDPEKLARLEARFVEEARLAAEDARPRQVSECCSVHTVIVPYSDSQFLIYFFSSLF